MATFGPKTKKKKRVDGPQTVVGQVQGVQQQAALFDGVALVVGLLLLPDELGSLVQVDRCRDEIKRRFTLPYWSPRSMPVSCKYVN